MHVRWHTDAKLQYTQNGTCYAASFHSVFPTERCYNILNFRNIIVSNFKFGTICHTVPGIRLRSGNKSFLKSKAEKDLH